MSKSKPEDNYDSYIQKIRESSIVIDQFKAKCSESGLTMASAIRKLLREVNNGKIKL